MRADCLRALIPSHTAGVGEIMRVLWSDYYGAVIFGDRREIACIPHNGCRLEIVATADATHPLVKLLLPGHVIRYTRSFFFRDRFELPSGVTVGLHEFVGFNLQLAPSPAPMPPTEELILGRAQHGEDSAGGSDLLVPSQNDGGDLARPFQHERRR
jgi:hypothetical protein